MSLQRTISCYLCYTEHQVELSNEDGTNKHIPISSQNKYLWTKQIHPQCSSDQLICRSCIVTHLTVRLGNNQNLSCVYCGTALEHEVAMQVLPEDMRDQCEKKYWLSKGLKECYNTNCRSLIVFEVRHLTTRYSPNTNAAIFRDPGIVQIRLFTAPNVIFLTAQSVAINSMEH